MIQDQERSTAGLSAVTLFNLYTDHIMRNVQLDESQAGIKIGRRNINNPKYADQLSSVTQSCPNLCDPMDCNTPGFPVYHQIMELVQKLMSIESRCHPTISSSVIPLSSRSFPMSQFFTSVAKVLELQFQHQSFQ